MPVYRNSDVEEQEERDKERSRQKSAMRQKELLIGIAALLTLFVVMAAVFWVFFESEIGSQKGEGSPMECHKRIMAGGLSGAALQAALAACAGR